MPQPTRRTHRRRTSPIKINPRIARTIVRHLHGLDIEVRPPCPVCEQKSKPTAWDFRISFSDGNHREYIVDSGPRYTTQADALSDLCKVLLCAWQARAAVAASLPLTKKRINQMLGCFKSPGFGLLKMDRYSVIHPDAMPLY